MADLQELKTSILEDGVVDADEVAQLRQAIFEDGTVDREEANVLFDINDKVSGKENAPEWTSFFVEAVSAHVLADDKTPNVIDDEEAAYLQSKIEGDGMVDNAEKALLQNLKEKAQGTIPTALQALITAHAN